MTASPATRTPPVDDAPRVSIIVLTYNAPYWTERCLHSLFGCTDVPYELIVVDNGSGSDTLSLIDAYRAVPGVTIVENGRNTGFARGNNIGLEQARGELVLFLNSDVIVTPDWLKNLVAALDSRSDVAAVGPRTNHGAGLQGGVFLPSLEEAEIDRFGSRFNRHDPSRWREAERLSAFALLVRRSVLDEVGPFDEQFEIGTAEDRELCDRIRGAGHALLCAGDCFVFHAGHASFLENRLNFKHRHNLNRIAYGRREAGRDEAAGHRLAGGPGTAPAGDLEADDSIITLDTGAKYLVHDGVLHPISQMDAVRLLPYPVRDGSLAPEVIDGHPVGDPIFFIRSWGPTIYLFALGRRHPVLGSADRIAEIEGVTVVRPEYLEAVPEAESRELA